MTLELPPSIPREAQTLRLTESRLESFREWAEDGTALATAARVRGSDGRIALVKNRWSEGWTLPGGAVEPSEQPAAAARREVREETGLEATVGDPLVVLEQTYASVDDGREQFSATYAVYDAHAAGEIPDADELGTSDGEIEAARWFDSIPENLHDGAVLRPYL